MAYVQAFGRVGKISQGLLIEFQFVDLLCLFHIGKRPFIMVLRSAKRLRTQRPYATVVLVGFRRKRFIVDELPYRLLIQRKLIDLFCGFHIWETSFRKTQKQRGIIPLFGRGSVSGVGIACL